MSVFSEASQEGYLRPCQTSMMEFFAEVVNSYNLLFFSAKMFRLTGS